MTQGGHAPFTTELELFFMLLFTKIFIRKTALVGRLVEFNHNRKIKGSDCNYRNHDLGISAFSG